MLFVAYAFVKKNRANNTLCRHWRLIYDFYLDYSKINRNFAIERIIINLITRQAYEEIQL